MPWVFPEGAKTSTIPKLVKINGTKDKPIHTLYIGRSCNMGGWKLPQSKWHNPYKGDNLIEDYYEYIFSRPDLVADLPELSGHTLGCWCSPKPCHGQVLQYLYMSIVLGGVYTAENKQV